MMDVPWKDWCRLCASPNGGVQILDPDENDHFLSDKIRKYMSISVSKEDKIPCLLCSNCCNQLAAFDNFVHRCLQVQAMFSALCELEEGNLADEKLQQLKKEFLSCNLENSKEKAQNGNPIPQVLQKKEGENPKTSVNKAKKKGITRKKLPADKENCDMKIRQTLESNATQCRKSERLKEMAEMKRAFGEEDPTFNDSLDSDFNEDSFQNLLDSEDNFQSLSRSNQNGFKLNKNDLKSIDSLCDASGVKQMQSIEFAKDSKSEKSSDIDRTSLLKKDEVAKLSNSICSNDLDCDVLSSDVNGTSINSLSDTDINDFICNDNNDNGDETHSVEIDNNNHRKEFKTIEGWKNGEKSKSDEPCKLISEQEELNELSDMFHEAGNDDVCIETDEWSIHETVDNEDEIKKSKKRKDQSTFRCDQCDKSFHRKALLNVHLKSHMPKDQQPYVCCKCARRFYCESLLRNHERVHLPNEEKLVYPCNICSKKFSSKSAVTAHLKAIHFGERPFVCHLCGHSFSSKGILQDHITIHSDEEPWHCTKCTKKFKTKYRLKIHMDTHRETPYSCPHCPVQLSTRRTLRMHLVVHRDTKAYQCSTCGKEFRRAKDLKNHQNLHTGRRPYTCPFCSRTFANGSNCRSHKRRMHPEELRLYEAALAGNMPIGAVNNSTSVETNPTDSNNLIAQQDLDEEGNLSMKEDSQDSLLTEMALDLQQPQILTVKSSLIVHEGPEVTAADLTLAPLVTLSSTLPKLEPDDSRLVMNLTTQIHDTHDSMDAMSPLNLNIMSPMNLNISSPLNLNISSPLNLNISSVLHSPTGRNQQQQHTVQSQHNQNSNRYQPLHHQTQQQPQHLAMQPTHQTHQQQHQQLTHQPQLHQQINQQQMPRSTIQIATLQTPLNTASSIHTLSQQTQLPAHLNNTVHHNAQTQNFVPLNQQSTLYTHHSAHSAHAQDSISSTALISAATMAHSVTTSSTTVLPSFSSNPYVQHSMVYGRSGNM